ncbi:MAG: Branched-chain amino acid transporter, amino acid-binding protein [Ramlibacter sp.]|nr:Branched-chain amino acid transporter, amino acid-binding protein [Ramlibacter sp.]
MQVLRRLTLAASAALALSSLAALPAAAQELPVAIFGATSGVFAFGGVPIQNGMRMALEEANAKGMPGGAKIKIIEGDTAADKAQAISLATQFGRRDKAILIMGPTNSFEAIAAGPVVNELQVPMFAIGSSNAILATGPWAFKVQAQAVDIMGFLAKYVAEKSGIKKVALVFDQGSDGIIEQKNAFRDGVKAGGVAIVSENGILTSESNFLALATKLASQDVDGIYVGAPPEITANLAIQLRQAGLPAKVRIIGPSSLASLKYMQTGGKAVEGTIIIADYAAASSNPLNAAFLAAYKARYKETPDNWAAMGYTLGQIGVQAIRNAGPNPDRAKVRAELEKITNVPVVMGNGLWVKDKERHPTYGGVMLTVKNGELALLP